MNCRRRPKEAEGVCRGYRRNEGQGPQIGTSSPSSFQAAASQSSLGTLLDDGSFKSCNLYWEVCDGAVSAGASQFAGLQLELGKVEVGCSGRHGDPLWSQSPSSASLGLKVESYANARSGDERVEHSPLPRTGGSPESTGRAIPTLRPAVKICGRHRRLARTAEWSSFSGALIEPPSYYCRRER